MKLRAMWDAAVRDVNTSLLFVILFVVLSIFGYGILANTQSNHRQQSTLRVIAEQGLHQSQENHAELKAFASFVRCSDELGPARWTNANLNKCIEGAHFPTSPISPLTPSSSHNPAVIYVPRSDVSPSPTEPSTRRPAPHRTPSPRRSPRPSPSPMVCLQGTNVCVSETQPSP